jgi:hypothetical protein
MTTTIEATDLQVGDRVTNWTQRPIVARIDRDGSDYLTITIDTADNGRHRVSIHRYHELAIVR